MNPGFNIIDIISVKDASMYQAAKTQNWQTVLLGPGAIFRFRMEIWLYRGSGDYWRIAVHVRSVAFKCRTTLELGFILNKLVICWSNNWTCCCFT